MGVVATFTPPLDYEDWPPDQAITISVTGTTAFGGRCSRLILASAIASGNGVPPKVVEGGHAPYTPDPFWTIAVLVDIAEHLQFTLIPASGSWDSGANYNKVGSPLPVGTNANAMLALRAFFDFDGGDTTGPRFTTASIAPPAIEITTLSLPNVAIGVPYSEAIAATGGTSSGYAWTLDSGTLPPGLVLAPTGTPSTLLSGTPTMVGVFDFVVRVTDDGANTDTQAYRIEVLDPTAAVYPATDTIRGGTILLVSASSIAVDRSMDEDFEFGLPAGWTPTLGAGARVGSASRGVVLSSTLLGNAALTSPTNVLGLGEVSIEVALLAVGAVEVSVGALALRLTLSILGSVLWGRAGVLPGSTLPTRLRVGEWVRIHLLRGDGLVWAAVSTLAAAEDVARLAPALGPPRAVHLRAPDLGGNEGPLVVMARGGGVALMRRLTVRGAVSVDGQLLLNTRAETPRRIVGRTPETTGDRIGGRPLTIFGPFGQVTDPVGFTYTAPVPRTIGRSAGGGVQLYADPSLRDVGPRTDTAAEDAPEDDA